MLTTDTIDRILIGPDKAEILKRDERSILNVARAAAAMGDDTLRLHINAVQMANDIHEAQLNAADAARVVGAQHSSDRFRRLAGHAEQLKLHHLAAIRTWLNGR